MQLLFKILDQVLSRIPWVNGHKTTLGLVAFSILSLLHQLEYVGPEMTLEISTWLSGWGLFAIAHKGAKRGLGDQAR